MKKLVAVFVMALCICGVVFAQSLDMAISGEVKTGLFWFLSDIEGVEDSPQGAFIHNSEENIWMEIPEYKDLRYEQGLFRLNFQIGKENIGAKFRFQTTGWPFGGTSEANWGYAFLYGNFFNDQLRFSVGKLGESPWGLNEEDFEKELDSTMGLRFEFLPSFLPGLNIGFALNDWNTQVSGETSIIDLLQETVLGVSYTNDYFHGRFAFRLDSEVDKNDRLSYATDQGSMLVYRLEERIIQNYLPGFQIRASGFFEDLGNEDNNMLSAANYLYINYEPEIISAGLRLGYNIVNLQLLDYGIDNSRQYFSGRPSFYFKLFNDLLHIGLAGEIAIDFGDGKVVSDNYLHWYIEPMIKLNMSSNAYLALVYRYQDDNYKLELSNRDDKTNKYTDYSCINSKTHWVNLRAVFTF